MPAKLRASSTFSSNSVAVLDFKVENPTANTSERVAGLEDFFEMALQKQNFPVLERRNIRLVLAERELQANGLLSVETLSQAKLPSVDYFVSCSVAFPSPGEFSMTLSIIRADKATVESTLTSHGTYPDDWLPTIESLAKEVSTRLQIQKKESTGRSEFEMMTWLPEAALPFFKGLEYYGRGDYASAVPWFRHSYEKDKHFDLARRWEARAYTKLNLFKLAESLSDGKTNDIHITSDLKRPVAAVVASEKISAAGRAAFMQALAQSGQFELFDPASIGATAREIDLQLTGQMTAPFDGRSVWLVVDDLIYLDAPDSETLAVRQQNLLSGEVQRQVKIRASKSDENFYSGLAKTFLESKPAALAQKIGADKIGQSDLSEPTRQDSGEVAMAKSLRLAAANPQSARLWIGLADFYPGETRKMLLEKAVNIIETNRQSPDAAFWLASALWREREMTRRIFYIPTATRLAPNPLTNDFARLLQWFPDSYEAKNLVEVTNHGEGSYVYTEIKERRYLGSVFTNNAAGIQSVVAPALVPVVTYEQKLAKLNDYLKQNRPAPAWQLVNLLRPSDGSMVQPQVQTNYDKLVQAIVQENQRYHEFTDAIAAKQSQRALELGRGLLNCADRWQRAEVIRKCGELIKDEQGVPEQLKFVLAEAHKYRDDFLIDPVTGDPGDNVAFQLEENNISVGRVVMGRDYAYEPMVGEVAEAAHDLPLSDADVAARILEDIRNDTTWPLEKRLTAAYDLAMVEQAQGRTFEALDLLEDVLRQSQGTGMPLRRNNIWSQSIENAAFDALLKIRIYADANVDVCDCCGKASDVPPQKPANYEEMNRLLGRLWKQQVGEAETINPPIEQQLRTRKEEVFPTILYKLQTDQEVSHMLIFCSDLGTNALPVLPIIMKIIHRGEPFQDYNNAFLVLNSLGRLAACAKPLLILARENSDNGNISYALKRIGPAPRRVMLQLAQLLYHKNPEICKMAACAVIETADLDQNQFAKISDEQLVLSVRQWWEEKGMKQEWGSNPQ